MFRCKVYQTNHDQEIVLLCKNFKSLKEIAQELGLTYAQVADFSSRRPKKNYKDFKFFPKIEITRIYKQELSNVGISTMPSNSKATPHQHQVLINQSLLNQIKQDVKYMKQDLVEIKAMIKYIKEYTEQKKEKEDARWFR